MGTGYRPRRRQGRRRSLQRGRPSFRRATGPPRMQRGIHTGTARPRSPALTAATAAEATAATSSTGDSSCAAPTTAVSAPPHACPSRRPAVARPCDRLSSAEFATRYIRSCPTSVKRSRRSSSSCDTYSTCTLLTRDATWSLPPTHSPARALLLTPALASAPAPAAAAAAAAAAVEAIFDLRAFMSTRSAAPSTPSSCASRELPSRREPRVCSAQSSTLVGCA